MSGEVKLVFSDPPLTLRRWEIVDPQGVLTQVSLVDPQFGIQVDEELFEYDDLEGQPRSARESSLSPAWPAKG